jgi:hypothetical protein
MAEAHRAQADGKNWAALRLPSGGVQIRHMGRISVAYPDYYDLRTMVRLRPSRCPYAAKFPRCGKLLPKDGFT